MSKQIVKNYTFNAAAKQITFIDYDTVTLERVLLITNASTNQPIYVFNHSGFGGSVTGNVLTLDYDTSAMSNSDPLQIIYEAKTGDPHDNQKELAGNVREKVRYNFDPTSGQSDFDVTKPASDIIRNDGNNAGSSYLEIIKSVANANQTVLLSKKTFKMPFFVRAGLTLSQRIQGEEFAFCLVGVDSTGTVIPDTVPADQNITQIVIASNVATVTTQSDHGYVVGQQVYIAGMAYSALNVGPVLITSVTATNAYTVACTATNGTYNTPATGQTMKCGQVDPTSGAAQIIGMVFNGNSSSNAYSVSDNATSTQPYMLAWNPGNSATDATYPTAPVTFNSPYSFAAQPKETFGMLASLDKIGFVMQDMDNSGITRSGQRRTQVIPDYSLDYKIRFRARSLPNRSTIVGRIISISKSGSNTATVNVPNHGLTAGSTGSIITIQGVRDQVNFANTGGLALVSVVDANNFTVSFGASATATSYGGFVVITNGGQALNYPTAGGTFQSIAKVTANGQTFLRVTTSTTITGLTHGEVWHVAGLVDSVGTTYGQYEGRYRVDFITPVANTVDLYPVDGQDLSALTSVNVGGSMVKVTQYRLHFLNVLDYVRQLIESLPAMNDAAGAMPVSIQGLNGSLTVAQGTASSLQTQNTPVAPSSHNLNSAASTNATLVKSTAGSLVTLFITNFSAATKYIKFYNKTTAPTVGTDIPLFTIPVPATSFLPVPIGEIGDRFTSGIAYAITNALADSDTTVIAAGDVKIKLSYI